MSVIQPHHPVHVLQKMPAIIESDELIHHHYYHDAPFFKDLDAVMNFGFCLLIIEIVAASLIIFILYPNKGMHYGVIIVNIFSAICGGYVYKNAIVGNRFNDSFQLLNDNYEWNGDLLIPATTFLFVYLISNGVFVASSVLTCLYHYGCKFGEHIREPVCETFEYLVCVLLKDYIPADAENDFCDDFESPILNNADNDDLEVSDVAGHDHEVVFDAANIEQAPCSIRYLDGYEYEEEEEESQEDDGEDGEGGEAEEEEESDNESVFSDISSSVQAFSRSVSRSVSETVNRVRRRNRPIGEDLKPIMEEISAEGTKDTSATFSKQSQDEENIIHDHIAVPQSLPAPRSPSPGSRLVSH